MLWLFFSSVAAECARKGKQAPLIFLNRLLALWKDTYQCWPCLGDIHLQQIQLHKYTITWIHKYVTMLAMLKYWSAFMLWWLSTDTSVEELKETSEALQKAAVIHDIQSYIHLKQFFFFKHLSKPNPGRHLWRWAEEWVEASWSGMRGIFFRHERRWKKSLSFFW